MTASAAALGKPAVVETQRHVGRVKWPSAGWQRPPRDPVGPHQPSQGEKPSVFVSEERKEGRDFETQP